MKVTTDRRSPPLTLAIAGLAAMATYLDTSILFVAFPDITEDFGDTAASTLSWVLNAYTIAFAALLVPAGKLADRLGHRAAFLLGSTIFTVASLLCGFAPNVGFLVGARILQGIGAAVLVPASLALVMAAFPREKLPFVVAIWGAIGAASAALGPSLGALIVDSFGWRWAFYINLPIGLVTVLAGVRYLAESRDPDVQIPSLTGVVLIAASAGLLIYGLVESDAVGWTSAQTITALGAGLGLLGLFIVNQKRTDAPTLDLELFSLNNFRWGNLGMFAYNVSFTAMFFGMILFLVDVWDWSILKAGVGVAPGPAVAAVLAPRFGKRAGVIGQRPLVMAGGLVAASSGLYRLVLLDEGADYWVDFFPPLMISAVSIGLVFPQVTSAAVQSLPANRTGVGGAVTQAVRQFAGSFGVAITIALLTAARGRDNLLSGFDGLWWLVMVGGLVTSACGMALRQDGRLAP